MGRGRTPSSFASLVTTPGECLSYHLWFLVYLSKDNDTKGLTDPLCLWSWYNSWHRQASVSVAHYYFHINVGNLYHPKLCHSWHLDHQIRVWSCKYIWFLLKISLICSYIYSFITNFDFWFYIFLWLDFPLGCTLVLFVKNTFLALLACRQFFFINFFYFQLVGFMVSYLLLKWDTQQ